MVHINNQVVMSEFHNLRTHLEKVWLLFITDDLRAYDRSTGAQGEHIANEWFPLSLLDDHVGNLYHWIFIWLWENSYKEMQQKGTVILITLVKQAHGPHRSPEKSV